LPYHGTRSVVRNLNDVFVQPSTARLQRLPAVTAPKLGAGPGAATPRASTGEVTTIVTTTASASSGSSSFGGGWLPTFIHRAPCTRGSGLCVSEKLGLVFTSESFEEVISKGVTKWRGCTIAVYSLETGLFLRRVGTKGAGTGEFDFSSGGICCSEDGESLFIAEYYNNRVQQVLLSDASWMRFFGVGFLASPQYVDCNSAVLVVSQERCGVAVMSRLDGTILSTFGRPGSGPGGLHFPYGLRLLADRSGVVVADAHNNRLCLLTLDGRFLRSITHEALHQLGTYDVMETRDGGFIAVNWHQHHVVRFAKDGTFVGLFRGGVGARRFNNPTALAALPSRGDEFIVLEWGVSGRFQLFRAGPVATQSLLGKLAGSVDPTCSSGELTAGTKATEPAARVKAVSANWPPVFALRAPCVQGYGMCVSVKHGIVIVSGGSKLHLYSLATGAPLPVTVVTKGFFKDKTETLPSIGQHGSGRGQFSFNYGGLSVSPDGDNVLVAEYGNNRVQEVRISDGSWVRFYGEGVLDRPQFVDCNASVIAVSERCPRVSLLSWRDGSALAQFGSFGSGPGQLECPCGIRLLADGRGLVVADHRLVVFSLAGELLTAIGGKEQGLNGPHDVLECTLDDSFIVASRGSHNLLKISRDGTMLGVYGHEGSGDGEFNCPSALAALPTGGFVVREFIGSRFQVFTAPRL
jgi:hypothetical protein